MIDGDDLRAWRVSVNWTVHQLARAMGYAGGATITHWEKGTWKINTLAQLALRWLMHITPKYTAPAAAMPLAKPKRRLWTTAEERLLLGFDSSPPGALLDMAIKLGRSRQSVSQRLLVLRKRGLAPKYSQLGRKRGARGRQGPPPLPETMTPPKAASGLMSDAYAVPVKRTVEWRSAIAGPRSADQAPPDSGAGSPARHRP